jgi:methionyl-tRNA formyltransferase
MNVFIGHYHQVLEAFHQISPVDLILVESVEKAGSVILEYAERHRIPLRVTRTSQDINDALTECSVRLAVVASFGVILRSPAICACEKIVNFHPGDVEYFRGRHPLPQTILNKWPDMCLTAHFIENESIDSGPLLRRLSLPINYDGSFEENYARLRKQLFSFASEALIQVLSGNYYARPFSPKINSYYRPLSSEVLSRILSAERLKDIVL